MSRTLVDTNVLLDVATRDPVWASWSEAQLYLAAIQGAVQINDVIYAELSVRYATMETLDAALARAGVTVVATPKAALFLAGKIFQRYRAAGGRKTGVLSDFFIGAHAAVAGLTLLTRDARRYRMYFPTVELVTP